MLMLRVSDNLTREDEKLGLHQLQRRRTLSRQVQLTQYKVNSVLSSACKVVTNEILFYTHTHTLSILVETLADIELD